MFNKIIQPTGIYGNLSIRPQSQGQNPLSTQNPSQNINEKNMSAQNSDNKKKGLGLTTKMVIIAFAAIGIIWGFPAIKKIGINKKNSLKDREIKILEKSKELSKQGNNALEKEKKVLEKNKKTLERDKKLFEKINNTPFLNTAKKQFIKVSDFLESKIQRPFKTFMQNHIFAFVKK